jgi:hypothetical protein
MTRCTQHDGRDCIEVVGILTYNRGASWKAEPPLKTGCRCYPGATEGSAE